MRGIFKIVFSTIFVILFSIPHLSQAEGAKIGVVVMHGKGGSPDRAVDELATALTTQGFLVANLEMPWSENRQYDVDTDAADAQIDKAIADMRAKGAQKIFISGHSQGGAFAIHYATTHPVEGLIPIVPGANPDSPNFQTKLGQSIRTAQKLVKEGKGDEKSGELSDYEGSQGLFPVITTPRIYLTWFGKDSAMNYVNSSRKVTKNLPVLFVEATRDYPSLHKYNMNIWSSLTKSKLTRLYEPEVDHYNAPSGSIDEVVKWIKEVVNASTK